jgi:hypothetical protein
MPPPPKENGIRNPLSANHYRLPQSRKSTRRLRPEYDHWDPTGKTPDEIAAWCADYERDQKGEMAKRRRWGIDGTLFLFSRTVQ